MMQKNYDNTETYIKAILHCWGHSEQEIQENSLTIVQIQSAKSKDLTIEFYLVLGWLLCRLTKCILLILSSAFLSYMLRFFYFSPLIFLVYSLHAPTSCLLFLVYILISFYRLSFISCTVLHSPAQSAY